MKNLMDMMKQAKQLQEKMAEMQTAVEAVTETGTSGAGLVSVTLNGKGVMNGLRIDPSLLKDGEGEILEDLIGKGLFSVLLIKSARVVSANALVASHAAVVEGLPKTSPAFSFRLSKTLNPARTRCTRSISGRPSLCRF